jgi:DNA repair exonuclease SbcCD ATPase subunit
MTTQQLEEKILEAVAELRDATDELTTQAREWAKADHAYRRAKSIAYLASSGTVAERQAHVDKTCGDERDNAHSAEALKEAAKEKVRALLGELSAYQTLAGLLRSEMSLEGRYER